MIESIIKDILDEKGIPVGKRISLIGEFRRGVPVDEIKKVEDDFLKIKSWYLDEIILIDFTHLKELDSIGIRNTFPIVIGCNEELSQKGRTLISILGNENSDIYNAIKDKFPDRNLDKLLPWFSKEADFAKAADIN